ncbi:alpha/beta fold hydrolase [Pseudonocardia abyssalis]|uniref:Alpha/beta hydrolase n=1 Tax=Pseudonocardia abyssalis TaxID=2792008 RepID=A0ABS6V055_9PSEU|nr:alpha/beta hydrolase [Pseudonocardia abyssalis]MBW0116190.1 alpha/beta hydrolase [Pseudonocardia abyssalis]MBW0137621.1 alpha/beta hydrolase [Pseudonocardia abyssalis]
MTAFVLVPGAGGAAFYWHLVVRELERRGHEGIAVDLPSGDPDARLADYVDAVVAGADGRTGVVLVGSSLGGFSAPLACRPLQAVGLVLVNAMIPTPGETGGQWWENTGFEAAISGAAERDGRDLAADPDQRETMFHDVPPEVAQAVFERPFEQEDGIFADAWPGTWPDVPTRVVATRDDRFFPVEFQRRIARERLGTDPEEMAGGHLVALSRPVELVDLLIG